MTMDTLANDLFDMVSRLRISTYCNRRNLVEAELLILSLFRRTPSLRVGDIRHTLGLFPAQMSRLLRSLENRSPPLIECRIDQSDKRRIDIYITADGGKMIAEYRSVCVSRIVDQLQNLTDDDQKDLIRVLNKLQD